MHVAFGSSDEPQVFVWEKSAALMPATLIPLKETAAVPLFWSVTVCGADENPTAVFAKLTLDGLACNAGDPACGISATWKSDGAALSWGWNGAEGDTRPNSDAVLSEGLFARFSNAESVSVGGVVFAGVVKAKSCPHAVESPAMPPLELIHAAITLPRVLIKDVGTARPAGTSEPGDKPVRGFTNTEADANADASEEASLLPDPIEEGELIKGASAETAATLETSLITTKVPEVNEEHGPNAFIRAILELPEGKPGFPPVAVKYTYVAFVQENRPSMLKLPFASEVTVCVNKGVALEPSPVVPTV